MTRREAQLERLLLQCSAALQLERKKSADLRAELEKATADRRRALRAKAQAQRQARKLRGNLANQRERLCFLLRQFEQRLPLAVVWDRLTERERAMAIRERLRPAA